MIIFGSCSRDVFATQKKNVCTDTICSVVLSDLVSMPPMPALEGLAEQIPELNNFCSTISFFPFAPWSEMMR